MVICPNCKKGFNALPNQTKQLKCKYCGVPFDIPGEAQCSPEKPPEAAPETSPEKAPEKPPKKAPKKRAKQTPKPPPAPIDVAPVQTPKKEATVEERKFDIY